MTPNSGLEDSLFGVILQDSYKVVGLLGEGGMGAVYDAMHVRLNKRVAVKMLSRDLASNEEALNRFHREAMITSGLGHPHIVQVFDFATTPNGQPFLAMEFLDGEDLHRRISRLGQLSPELTVHIVKQVASALAATHAQQIVHRDLKPANIYLLNVAGEDDFVKVLDFGISKIRVANTKITRASAVIGTPDYMSPEQAMGAGDDVDERTDQWALACIAWECLTGKAPFAADSIPAMLFQVVHGEPASLVAKVSGLSDAVEVVLRRALSKKKDDRFPNVVEFAQALEAAVQGKPTLSQVLPKEASAPHTETATYESATDENRTARPTTTFRQAAGETEPERPRAALPKRTLAIVASGVVVASLVAVFGIRQLTKTKPEPAVQATSSVPSAPANPTPAEPAAPAQEPAPSPTAAAPAPAPSPTAAAPAPAAPAMAPTAQPAPVAKPAVAEPTSDSKAPETEPAAKPHVKKTATGSHNKGKAPLPEHRLIKEL